MTNSAMRLLPMPGGNITLPKHLTQADAAYIKDLAALTDKVPDAHKQGFIRLHRRVFGLKVLGKNSEKF